MSNCRLHFDYGAFCNKVGAEIILDFRFLSEYLACDNKGRRRRKTCLILVPACADGILNNYVHSYEAKGMTIDREKGRDLTESYDKSPYIHRKKTIVTMFMLY